jgi:predicted dehydrogenase
VGSGIQGRKREKVCGMDFVGYVDPKQKHNKNISYEYTSYVPLDTYDAACVCTPSDASYGVCYYLINKGKHVLVEKPLWAPEQEMLVELQQLADKNNCVLYTGYNHRFEPSLINLKDLIKHKKIGKIYHCSMFYGNGTAKLVKESPWRDSGIGIYGELGSHLLDINSFLFGAPNHIDLISSSQFENNTPDHIVFEISTGEFSTVCEATYCSWKNTFTINILGEKGSIHVDGLCKWGPCRIEWRNRKYPSGVPASHNVSWSMDDPTWEFEYKHFKGLCENKQHLRTEQIKDREINFAINRLMEQQE